LPPCAAAAAARWSRRRSRRRPASRRTNWTRGAARPAVVSYSRGRRPGAGCGGASGGPVRNSTGDEAGLDGVRLMQVDAHGWVRIRGGEAAVEMGWGRSKGGPMRPGRSTPLCARPDSASRASPLSPSVSWCITTQRQHPSQHEPVSRADQSPLPPGGNPRRTPTGGRGASATGPPTIALPASGRRWCARRTTAVAGGRSRR
jgi:hypothetical protein